LSILFGTRDKEFFRLLNEQAEAVHAGAAALQRLLENYGREGSNLAADVFAVRQFEHRGDDLERSIIHRLNQAFITPLDREDIHNIATRLEFILDVIEGVADRVELYAVETLTPEVLALGAALTAETEALREVVAALGSLKAQAVLEAGQKLKRVEGDMDRHYREGVARLFKSDQFKPLEVLKLKEILEHMEEASDQCEDVADLIEGIVLKHA
jgi:predicted phosphate transport protein (TIGR00153 family)